MFTYRDVRADDVGVPKNQRNMFCFGSTLRKPWGALSNLDASVCVGQCNNDWGHMGFSGSAESSERIGAYTGLAAAWLRCPVLNMKLWWMG